MPQKLANGQILRFRKGTHDLLFARRDNKVALLFTSHDSYLIHLDTLSANRIS